MQKCKSYFKVDKKNFWEKFKLLNENDNKEYINIKNNNSISCKCIHFPKITQKEYKKLFNSDNSIIGETLIFNTCIFAEEVDFSNFSNLKKITFNNCLFKKNVNLSLIKPEKEIDINNCVFEETFYLKNFKTIEKKQNIKIQNSKFTSLFYLKQCLLEDTILFNIDFSKATLKFEEVNFEGLKANEIKWSNKIEASRDIFRQLKVLMENQKNFIDSAMFYSMELNEYTKELKKTKFYENYENIEDRIVFLFSKYTSNFSRSWILPLFWLILLSALLYIALCYNDKINTCNLNHFVQFFNPFDKKANEEFQNIYWIWFLHKIFAGFFIYQMIIALKRKTRF